MTQKHTKGPWRAIEHRGNIGKDLAGRIRIVSEARVNETRAALANISGVDRNKHESDLIAILPAFSEANARLIAAAPELLEALCSIVDRLNHNAQALHELPPKLYNEYINQARAAIQKATGHA